MPKYKLILRKVGLVVLVLIMIYFSLGALASIAMMVIEAITHQMSSEIQQDSPSFQPWLIYLGMTLMLIICSGFVVVAFFGHRAVRNMGRKKTITKQQEVY